MGGEGLTHIQVTAKHMSIFLPTLSQLWLLLLPALCCLPRPCALALRSSALLLLARPLLASGAAAAALLLASSGIGSSRRSAIAPSLASGIGGIGGIGSHWGERGDGARPLVQGLHNVLEALHPCVQGSAREHWGLVRCQLALLLHLVAHPLVGSLNALQGQSGLIGSDLHSAAGAGVGVGVREECSRTNVK
jgi:hypothetical protein